MGKPAVLMAKPEEKEDGSVQPLALHTRLMHLDYLISKRCFWGDEPFARKALLALEHSGDGRLWLPLTPAIFLAPIKLPQRLQCLLFNLFIGFILDLILIGAIKSIVRRPRPVYNKGMTIIVAADKWSFPSGHSSRAFLIAILCCMVALPLTREAGMSTLETILALSPAVAWAISTALSRVALGRHYLLDVVCGSFLGFVEVSILLAFLWTPESIVVRMRSATIGCLTLHKSCQDLFHASVQSQFS